MDRPERLLIYCAKPGFPECFGDSRRYLHRKNNQYYGLYLLGICNGDFIEFTNAASLVGQWLLARKYVENWPAWVMVNVVSVALFAYKSLWLTALLYALFVLMALAGWRAWQRMLPAAKTP